MQGIPGNSINLSAAQNDIGSHEYMEAETQDPNGASDSPKERSSRSSPSLFGGNPMGTRSWSVSPRLTVTPVLNDQLHKVQLQTTPKDTNHKHGPAPSSELTASPRSLADTLIQASKFETSGTVNTSTKGSAYYRGERTPRPSTLKLLEQLTHQRRVVPITAGKGLQDLVLRARDPGRQVRTVEQLAMPAKITQNRTKVPA